MKKNSRIFVAGHRGLAGSAIFNHLTNSGYTNVFGVSSSQLDLRDQTSVRSYFDRNKPEYVILAAAKVGGIMENKNNPAVFAYDNLMIQTNVIDAAYEYGVEKFLFLGTSCIYPSNYTVPIREEDLLNGPLEKTNEAYSIAKIAGIKLGQYYAQQYGFNFVPVMPPNLYGPGDKIGRAHV